MPRSTRHHAVTTPDGILESTVFGSLWGIACSSQRSIRIVVIVSQETRMCHKRHHLIGEGRSPQVQPSRLWVGAAGRKTGRSRFCHRSDVTFLVSSAWERGGMAGSSTCDALARVC